MLGDHWDDEAVVVLAILEAYPIPPKLNHTYVTLSPKKPKPEKVTDF